MNRIDKISELKNRHSEECSLSEPDKEKLLSKNPIYPIHLGPKN